MGARSREVPADAKIRISDDSAWRSYPKVFGGVGVAALLMAGVLGYMSGSEGGHDEAHGDVAAAHHAAEAAHGDAHGGHAEHGDDHGAGADHGEAHADHGDDAAHGGEAHAEHSDDHEGHAGAAHGAEEDHGGGHHGHGPGNRFFFSYLTAYMYGLSLALGGLFFVIIQFLVKAGWSVVVRRIAENIMGTLPLFALLFIPVAAGFSETHFHWWDVPVGADALLDGKRAYLDKGFFLLRALVYVGLWVYMAYYFRRWSLMQDETGDRDITYRLQGFSPIAVILFGLSVTFAAIDWIKTMDPHWYSTMWGVYYFAGCLVGIFSSLIVSVLWLQSAGYIRKVINEEHYHDMGKLLFGFTVFWTYIAFSQYFLIWYANIPEEQLWYGHRSHGGWGDYGIFLAVGHFFLPFFFLLPRAIKRNPVTLFIAAAWMLFIHYVDIYFMIMPVYSQEAFSPSVIDALTVVGVVALFVAAFVRLTVKAALIPTKDPRLPESVAFENF